MSPAALLAAVLALSHVTNAPGAQSSEAPVAESGPGRVVVVVLYGADADLVERGMESGRLRQLAALRDAGTKVEVVSALPNDNPTIWAGLATGADRLRTLVPGFIGVERTDRIVFPSFGHIELSDEAIRAAVEAREDGLQAPVKLARNLIEGVPFWEHAAKAGVPTVVLRAGMSHGRPETEGLRILYGEGVLDATGEFGAWAVYTSHADELVRVPRGRSTPTAGTVYRVDPVDGRVETELFGPTDAVAIARLERELDALAEDESLSFERTWELTEALQERLSALRERPAGLPLTIAVQDDEARITIDGTAQALAEGAWSEPFRLRFELESGFTVAARTRVKLLSLRDPLRLYVDSLDVDPLAVPPWGPLGSPAGFVEELAEAVGSFDTYGQGASATMGVKDGELDAQTLLEDVEHTLRNAERLTQAVLERDDWRLLVTTFTAADRAGVVLMRHADPTHPLHDPELAARAVDVAGVEVPLSLALDRLHVRLDEAVGSVRAALGENDTLLVLSPAGMAPFRTQVDLNAWLARNGFLALQPGTSRASMPGAYVDWGRTKAYSLGFGAVYLNRAGREPEGIVTDEEAPDVLAELQERLLASEDPGTGEPFVAAVEPTGIAPGDEAFTRLPELYVGFRAGYRIAWTSTGGGMRLVREDGVSKPGPILYDNDSPWSGAHASVAGSEVPGFLIANRRLAAPDAPVSLLQVAPTVLRLVGVEPPEAMRAPALEPAD